MGTSNVAWPDLIRNWIWIKTITVIGPLWVQRSWISHIHGHCPYLFRNKCHLVDELSCGWMILWRRISWLIGVWLWKSAFDWKSSAMSLMIYKGREISKNGSGVAWETLNCAILIIRELFCMCKQGGQLQLLSGLLSPVDWLVNHDGKLNIKL